MAVLMLAGAAWNSAIGDDAMREQHRKLVAQIDWGGVTSWAETRRDDTERLIAELELLRVIGLMQDSRMGIFVHEGVGEETIVLGELVTDRVCRAICPSGYRGRKGELWYVRVLPPPVRGLEEHVVFTTPYLLIMPSEHESQAYFHRTLPDAPSAERIATYEHHRKFGPARDYWSEFVFEAYVNHGSDVIFLAGLPDFAESRPHSRIISQ
jgi:hypothetical protein